MARTGWGFYGRTRELAQLEAIFRRDRWFFLKLSGRRRIGKTSLVQKALTQAGRERYVYVQVPDSDAAGVIATVRDFYGMFGVVDRAPTDLRSLAGSVAALVRDGFIVVLDEFQYFNRKALFELTSHLQYEVDRLAGESPAPRGGLVVLGSIHTEMSALLEDRSAPLFNRVTDQMELPHLDIASVLEILRTHADASPERLLFLWNLFEGVPKLYRDCWEQDVIASDRRTLLARMFFSSSSPLRTEAESWFLRELHGRYDLVLKYVANHPGCSAADLDAHARSLGPSGETQVSGYIKVLRDRYGMIERLQPVFARPTARSGRFFISDNFLRAWLAALATPAASVSFRPVEVLAAEADARLADTEGYGLERLAGALYQERSQKGLGDFKLTERIQGYWDRQGTELDLVALDEDGKVLRLGSCKRSADKLVKNLPAFDGHVERFLRSMPRFASWRVEKVAIAPRLTPAQRHAIRARGYLAQDLVDLTEVM